MKLRKAIGVIATFAIAMPCQSDLPLNIEDLILDKKELQVELGLNYSNINDSNYVERKDNDIFTGSFGIRYGFTDETEVYGRLRGVVDNTRAHDGTATDKHSTQKWQELAVGVNHRFSDDNTTPAFLGFAEIAIIENTSIDGSNWIYGKSGQVGFTTYRSIDPLVLSLTTGYRFSGSRSTDGKEIKPGDSIFVTPRISFAVNDEITLTGGTQFSFQRRHHIDKSPYGIDTTQTALTFGAGFSPTKNTVWYFNVSGNISGNDGAEANLSWLYTL